MQGVCQLRTAQTHGSNLGAEYTNCKVLSNCPLSCPHIAGLAVWDSAGEQLGHST